jgi:signal transduction histidine kinase
MTQEQAWEEHGLFIQPGGQDDRFGALIDESRAAILAAYAAALAEAHSLAAADPATCDLALAEASDIINDVVSSLRCNAGQIGEPPEMLSWMAGQTLAEDQLSPADWAQAAAMFFRIAVSSLASHVTGDGELLQGFTAAVLALNDSIFRRITRAVLARTGYLLERVDHAHLDERRRIARDLHDRLGEGMSAALRQLELHELADPDDPQRTRVTTAREALAEAMRQLRLVTSDLRQDSMRNLEKALVTYIDSAATDADVRLRVSGDEGWASPAIIDEAYLIIREAIRNALRHAKPRTVLIGIALAPHELHAWVDDDGRGFVPSDGPGGDLSGTGLTSMLERAAMIGGRLTLDSVPGRGTRVELLVPLPGHRDDRRS